MSIIEITKEPGVSDLPLRAKAHFARALAAERNGGSYTVTGVQPITRTAEEWLKEAILAEANPN